MTVCVQQMFIFKLQLSCFVFVGSEAVCSMLGYDVSFAFIHAVKLAQQGSILERRVGMFE